MKNLLGKKDKDKDKSKVEQPAPAPVVNDKKKEKKKHVEEDVLEFFYKPHTISAMIIGGAIVVYFAFTRDEVRGASTQDNVKAGLLAGAGVFLLFSMLQMRDSIFTRPHPAVWRVVMGASVLYLMGLIFLLFQNLSDARKLMKYIDPKLGVELPERDYAAHCELYTPDDPTSRFRNLWDTVNDEFIWAHLIGWWGKTMLIRDAGLCWTLSILFEFWEMTFEHMLPNFKECWWDHIILDILVCNGLGIYLGLLTCRYLQMKEYDWTGLWRSTTRTQTINTGSTTTTTTTSTTASTADSSSPLWKRFLGQLVPQTYDEFHWDILQSPKRLFACVVMILIISLVELNAFWLKYLLWIPPPHPINIWRLLMWSALGLPGLREYYQYVADPTNKKFGTSAWLCCAVAGAETLVEIKFGRGQFPTPAPPSVYIPWTVFTVLFIGGFFIYFTIKARREKGGAAAPAAAAQKKKK